MPKELEHVFVPQPEKTKRMDEWKRNVTRVSNTPDGIVKVGSIFVSGCGDKPRLCLRRFFQITSVSKSGLTCTVRELRQETKDGHDHLNWYCRPIPDAFVGDPQKHRVDYSIENIPRIKLAPCRWGALLDDSEIGVKWFDASDND